MSDDYKDLFGNDYDDGDPDAFGSVAWASDPKTRAIIRIAIQFTQQAIKEERFLWEQDMTIAHVSDPKVYLLDKIEGEILFGYRIEDGERIEVQFPSDEVFHPDYMRLAEIRIKIEELRTGQEIAPDPLAREIAAALIGIHIDSDFSVQKTWLSLAQAISSIRYELQYELDKYELARDLYALCMRARGRISERDDLEVKDVETVWAEVTKAIEEYGIPQDDLDVLESYLKKGIGSEG